MILLTGATGNTGSELASLLQAEGVPFRCMVRRDEARKALASQGLDAVYGDYDAVESLAPALEGVTKAYLVCTPEESLVERECNFIDAAAASGVGHIVKLSALLAATDAPTPNLRFHGEVEEKLKDSGLAYTILRPHGFMQTMYIMSQGMIHTQGVMPFPGGDGSASYVDLRDVAKAAFQVLTTGGHEGKCYDLTGPAAVSFVEMAEILSRALGRPVTYFDAPEAGLVQALDQLGVTEAAKQHVLGIFRLIREDQLSFTTDSLVQIGVEPGSFEDFAADLGAGTTAGATSFTPPAPGS